MRARTLRRSTLRIITTLACATLLGATAHAERPARIGQTEWTDEAEARGHGPGERLRPVAPRANEHRGSSPGVRRLRPRRYLAATPAGALSGKVVYLSPGHGYVYSGNKFSAQRPNLFNVVEDMSNADGIAQFLVPYLLAAGAQVVPVREIDPNPEQVILDDADGASQPDAGRYVESGDAALFSSAPDADPGWRRVPLPITDETNPFDSAGTSRLIQTATAETARATYALNVPRAGYYNVHVSHAMGPGRPSDAEVIVRHPGGETTFLVDQRRHGGTWVLLGRFYFEAGDDEARAAVAITNRSAEPGTTVSVDAVRIGGGLGVLDRGLGPSNLPRADECSRYHAQLAGAPPDVYNPSNDGDRTDDISTRSRFADWHHAPGEEAIYLSHHSNAFNGATRGTETYVYGPNPPNGSMEPTQTTIDLGSVELANAVHGEVIADLRAEVDPAWPDRKVKSAYFGEINPANQDEMAAMLIEIAFHDQEDDAALLRDARFRRLVARSMYKGIVKYFAGRDGVQPRLLPEPPQALVARNSGPGVVTVSWQPPPFGGSLGDPAESYRVYRSASGYAFDGGTDSAGALSFELAGLTPGQVLYLRVTATNAGGESLPSPTLAVGVSATGTAPVLLVAGYDRLDPAINVQKQYPDLDTVDRLLIERMNNGTYLVLHGRALAPTAIPFDAATRDAVDAAAIDLAAGHAMVIWQAGRGANPEQGLTAASSAALSAAASAGVAVMVSGTTVARGLSLGGPDQQGLLADVLGATFVTATVPQRDVAPTAEGALVGLAPFSLAGAAGIDGDPYATGVPDVIAAAPAGQLAATYGPATGQGAAVQLKQGTRCSLLLGFPLETVSPPGRQAEILARVVDLCGIEAPAPPDGGLPQPDAGVGGDGGGGDDGGCSCAVPANEAPLGALLMLLLAGLVRRLTIISR